MSDVDLTDRRNCLRAYLSLIVAVLACFVELAWLGGLALLIGHVLAKTI